MAIAVPAFPALAHADDAAVVEAKARFEEGLALADAGNHEPARLKFQQAWAVFKSPAVLYNLARSEQLTGHDLEALEHFKLFIKVGATDVKITDAMREKAKLNAAELARKVAQVDIEVPATARVTLDGKAFEETPREPVPVSAGRHTIEASFDGRVKRITVECVAGNIVKAKIDFESGAVTEPPGEHPRGGGWSTGRIVTVSALAVGAVAGGVLFFVFRSGAQGNVDDSKDLLQGGSCINVTNAACTQASGLKDDRDTNVTLSTVSIIAGGTFAAGAVAAALFWPKRSSESARIAPVVAPGYGGASLVGRF